VQIWCDNQAAVADCQRMRGKRTVAREVRRLYLLAWENDVRLTFVWRPRSQDDLVLADELSKPRDPTD
jgi:hypothetical protein